MVITWLLHPLIAAASTEPRMGFLESFLGWRSNQIISSERIVSLGTGNSDYYPIPFCCAISSFRVFLLWHEVISKYLSFLTHFHLLEYSSLVSLMSLAIFNYLPS